MVLAKNLPDAEGNAKPLYCAQPLNLPFEDEAAAKTAAVDAKFDELLSPRKSTPNRRRANSRSSTGAL